MTDGAERLQKRARIQHERLHPVSDWQVQIPKCFGPETLVFASTPAELACAWQLRAEISEARVPPSLLESAIEDWLHTETSNTGQLFEQMVRVRAFFGS